MIVERLVIEDGGSSRYVEFHQRLTVVPGLDGADRRVLLSELRSALGAHRDGVHLEIKTDSGVSLAAFRGIDGHRMINVDTTTDVSSAFTDPAGRLNPAYGLAVEEDGLVIDSQILANRNDEDRKINLLSGADQEELWGVLDRIAQTRQATTEAEAHHADLSAPQQDSQVSAEVYDNYFASSETVPLTKKLAAAAGLAGVIGAAVLYFVMTSLSSVIPMVLGALSLVILGFFGYPIIRQLLAQRAANSALEEAGVDNFFNFQLQQVDGMMAQDEQRKKLREAAADHDAAIEEWTALAGDIDPDFALSHRTTIQLGASLRAADPDDDPNSGFLHPTTPLLLRCVGAIDSENERSPRILDAPFEALDETTRATLLDIMFEASAHRQIILLAGSDDAAAWALKHLDGNATVSPGFQTTAQVTA